MSVEALTIRIAPMRTTAVIIGCSGSGILPSLPPFREQVEAVVLWRMLAHGVLVERHPETWTLR